MTYQTLSTVMSSTADGTVVPSAYGDQVRDNVVAMHDGYWFATTGVVSQAMAGTVFSLVQMSTTVESAGLAASEFSLSGNGYVLLSKVGVWQIWGAAVGTVNMLALAISQNSTTARAITDCHYDNQALQMTVAGVIVVTTVPSYVSIWMFNNSGGAANLSSAIAPTLAGQWLGNSVVSFVDPVTIADPITGTKATAALLNTWRTDHEFLHNAKAGCRARTNTASVVAALGVIPFELEDFDNNGCHSTSTNTSRITIPSGWDGVYQFGFCGRVSTTSVFRIIKNGVTADATALARQSSQNTVATTSSGIMSGEARLVATDYIEVIIVGGATIVTTFNPVFWAQWIKP